MITQEKSRNVVKYATKGSISLEQFMLKVVKDYAADSNGDFSDNMTSFPLWINRAQNERHAT